MLLLLVHKYQHQQEWGVVKDLISYNPKLKPYLSNFYLIYTEQVRNASKEINKTIIKANSKEAIFENLFKSKRIGLKAKKLLLTDNNLSAFSTELTKQWKIKLERSLKLSQTSK